MEVDEGDGIRLDLVASTLPDALRALLLDAGEEARSLQHHYVGTGHLAVAAIRAGEVKEDLPSARVARDRLEGLLGRGTSDSSASPQLTPRAMQALDVCRGGSDPVADLLPALRTLDASVANHILFG